VSTNKFTIARRGTWYVLRTLLVVTLVVVLCLLAFVTAMNLSSIYILVTEGLELRAECILQEGDVNALTEYFSTEFVEKDIALYEGRYQYYTVSNFLYKLEVRGISMLPGGNSATMEVYEKLLSVAAKANEDAPEWAVFPEWVPAIYDVKLQRMDGRWYITDMILVQSSPVEKPLPSPNPTLTAEDTEE